MLGKLGGLPGSINVSGFLDSSFNSNPRNLKSQKMNSTISAEIKKNQPEI
jgi:hypothetical protein